MYVCVGVCRVEGEGVARESGLYNEHSHAKHNN